MIGNTLGLIILSKKRMAKIGPIKMYIYLFSLDIIYLIKIFIDYISYNVFKVDLTLLSKYACKFMFYLNYSLDVGSPMLLVYISCEKLTSIKYPSKSDLLRKNKFQMMYFMVITIFNLILYLPVFYNSDKITFFYHSTESNETSDSISRNRTLCTFSNADFLQNLSFIDLLNRALIPFVLMIVFTSLLILTIQKSRRRIKIRYSINENRTFKRDLKFSVSSILMNIIYLVLNLPRSLFTIVIAQHEPELLFTIYLFYLSFAVNFYVILVSNSIFRKEFVLFTRNLIRFKCF